MKPDLIAVIFIWLGAHLPLMLLELIPGFWKWKAVHRVLSLISILSFLGLTAWNFYHYKPEFAILSLPLTLIYYSIYFGLSELPDQELQGLAVGRSSGFLKLGFMKIVVFPPYYFVRAWGREKNVFFKE